MFSKFVTSMVVRQSRMAPVLRQVQIVSVQQRGFLDRLGLEAHSSEVAVDAKGSEVSLWQDKAKSQEHALVLKDNDQVEKYVLSIVKNYFRTTKKASVSLDTPFKAHGLDSLDVIELII